MQFTEGAKVYTTDGERIGTIDRVVLEPDTNRVTHLVVQKGFLFAEDKVIPMSLVGPATEDRVTLRQDADVLEALPTFEVTQYVEAGRKHEPARISARPVRSLFWYPPLGTFWTASAHADFTGPHYVPMTEKNIPEGTIALKEGAKVVSSDGEHIGDVESVFTDPQEERVTHLLISEGLILKEKRLVPTNWMANVLEDEIHLCVDSDFVEGLPEYQLPD